MKHIVTAMAVLLCLALLAARTNDGFAQESDRVRAETAFKAGDYETALKWYRRAAKQSDAEAQYMLGIMYATGRGVQKDDDEAEKWFRLATKK